jgi:type II secretory pathway pseudopilin PulG
MAHRAEEKERRRRERLEQEQAARRAAARKRTLQLGGGIAVALAVVAVIAVVALGGGGGGDDDVDESKLTADARAAGCTFRSFGSEGRTHTADQVTYKTNPPTSGNHNPTPAQDGIYRVGNTPPKENYVHTLEHGRIEFQYKPGTPAAEVTKLRRLAEEPLEDTAGYHTLLFENNTNMPAQFAATAWTKSITCPTLTPQALQVMRDFRKAYTDKAPEFIP